MTAKRLVGGTRYGRQCLEYRGRMEMRLSKGSRPSMMTERWVSFGVRFNLVIHRSQGFPLFSVAGNHDQEAQFFRRLSRPRFNHWTGHTSQTLAMPFIVQFHAGINCGEWVYPTFTPAGETFSLRIQTAGGRFQASLFGIPLALLGMPVQYHCIH